MSPEQEALERVRVLALDWAHMASTTCVVEVSELLEAASNELFKAIEVKP